jgi:hypothetical protein
MDPKNAKSFDAIEKAMYFVDLDDDATVNSMQVSVPIFFVNIYGSKFT